MGRDFKKIVFTISSLGSGGAERVVATLANEMTLRGYEVSIILIRNGRVHYPLIEQVRLIKLECGHRYDHLNGIQRYSNRIKDIRDAIIASGADVVVSFMSEINIDVCFAAIGLKIPVIVSERNDPSIDPASSVKQIIRKLAYCRADGFVFQTPDAQSYFSDKIQRDSCIILNPLTTQLPEPHIGIRDKRIVAVGRLHKQKNYPLLFNAFYEFSIEYPEYVLEIYGDGLMEDQFLQLLEEKGLTQKVLLKGFCKDVHNQIRSAAFFVMTSDYEGMPNALVEAMALGMPCISTDCRCGGPRLLIKDGENGLLVPTGQIKSLLHAMLKLAQNPQFAKTLGSNAELIKERVDTQLIVDQWLAYIGKINKKGRKNEN